MHFTVYGSGAMGGSLGAYMARAGEKVLFVDKEADHVRAMNKKGLCIDGENGEITVPVEATVPETLDQPLDVVLLAVKSQHTQDALEQFAPLLQPDSIVVSIQNGLNEDLIADRIGRDRTVGAFVNWGADYLGPGHINFGKAGCFYIGELDGRISPRLKVLQQAFEAFLPVETTDNIMGYLWSKQVFSSLLFATAMVDLPIYDVLEPPEVRRVMGNLVREAMQVPDALGIKLETYENEFFPQLFRDHKDDQALDIVANHFRGRIKNKTGVWRDLAVRKRPTEVEGSIGAAVRIGEAHGVALPLNRCLVRCIHDLEEGRRVMGFGNFDTFGETAGWA